MSPQASVNLSPRAFPNAGRRGPARGLIAARGVGRRPRVPGPALTASAAAAQNGGSAFIADRTLMVAGGNGKDFFVWNPGQGSDAVDGGNGNEDVMQFNGANVNETMSLSANGSAGGVPARSPPPSAWT